MSRPVARFRMTLALLAVLLAPALGQAADAQEKTPQTIYDPMVPEPVWVSAKLAEKTGLADRATFDRYAAQEISYVLSQTPVAGCYQAGPVVVDIVGGHGPQVSLEGAARSYAVFAYGTVKELTPGFLAGEAGHLARVEVTEISRGAEIGETVFVFIPLGEFTFLGKKICKEDRRYVGLPVVGDELLVFSAQSRTTNARILYVDYPEAVFLISKGKVLKAPRLVMADASSSDGAGAPAGRDELLAMLPGLLAIPLEGAQR